MKPIAKFAATRVSCVSDYALMVTITLNARNRLWINVPDAARIGCIWPLRFSRRVERL